MSKFDSESLTEINNDDDDEEDDGDDDKTSMASYRAKYGYYSCLLILNCHVETGHLLFDDYLVKMTLFTDGCHP